ncbi:c-type cytochrome [Hymenobacter sp. DG25A]|jgi:mono/diheme cytochrome c family protein|uniref:c-type cytochrome n=1 Tax=Hymenobacter sp. DG25A TaxID=1385663 RepID=UPI0006BC2CEA|nr:cytochrome c [Hymenobacter sp. DG25A]ALD20753.1 cytochrome c class I [Hymenobacter sp. DG25A]
MPSAIHLLRGAAVAAAIWLLAGCFTNKQNEGARLYLEHCSNCHGEQGAGLRRLIPPLARADYLTKNRAGLPCILRKGQKGVVVVNAVEYNQVMPPHEDLTDSQITNILNFLQQSWGNKGEPYTIREVSDLLGACQGSDGR